MVNCDLHVHMALDGAGDYKSALSRHKNGPDVKYIRSVLSEYKEKGITFLRDGGDKYGAGLYASKIAEEYGITYLSPSFPIYKEGYYGKFIGKGFEYEKEYRRLIDDAKRDGASFIKLMFSGYLDFDNYGQMLYPDLNPADIKEMVNIAKGEGFSVMAHCSGQKNIMLALEAGIDSLEHGFLIEDEGLWALAELDCVWVPTISTVGNLLGTERNNQKVVKKIYDEHLVNIEIAAQRGAVIACGSDAGAFAVKHGRAAIDEQNHLAKVLGDKIDEILTAGEERIRAKFSSRL